MHFLNTNIVKYIKCYIGLNPLGDCASTKEKLNGIVCKCVWESRNFKVLQSIIKAKDVEREQNQRWEFSD